MRVLQDIVKLELSVSHTHDIKLYVCESQGSESVVVKVPIVDPDATFSFIELFERVMFVGMLFVEA